MSVSPNFEAQEEEILVLSSIYNGDVFKYDSDSRGGQLQIMFKSDSLYDVNGLTRDQSVKVKYLPPVIMYFEISSDYPTLTAPSFSLSCKWLNTKQLSELCRKMDEIWTENSGNVILFLWFHFLQNEIFEVLHLSNKIDISKFENGIESADPRAVQDLASHDLLYSIIVEYNELKLEEEFNSQLFSCGICFVDKLGSDCSKFKACGHTFCKECICGYFSVQIQDGAVTALICPADKCKSQASPDQVKNLVDEKTFARYDRLLLQAGLDSMVDVAYCPRKSCGCGVLVDQESAMGYCSDCTFAFCIYCKMAFHGVSPCTIKTENMIQLREQYLEASDAERELMEKRYGKKTLKKMVEESFSMDWIKEYSKPCPHCKTPIQKIDGCHKMTCTKCRSYFCWLCSELLNTSNPYSHFNNLSSKCFNRLFEGVPDD